MPIPLGHCPDCHSEITAEDAALPPLCPHCGHRLRPDTPDFVPAIKSCLSKYCTWRGRATRAEYWWFQLLQFIVCSVCNIFLFFALFGLLIVHALSAETAEAMREGTDPPDFSTGLMLGIAVVILLPVLVELALFLPSLAVTVRRLHDTGRSAYSIVATGVHFLIIVVAMGICLGVSSGLFDSAGLTHTGTHDTAVICSIAVMAVSGLFIFGHAIHIFICTLLDSQRGPNKYGPSAKYPCA